MKKKKKGYVLAVVMLFSLLLAMVLVTTFALCYRYQRSAKRNLEELRQEVYKPAPTATPKNDEETADPTKSEGEQTSEPSNPAAMNLQDGELLGRFAAIESKNASDFFVDIATDNAQIHTLSARNDASRGERQA